MGLSTFLNDRPYRILDVGEGECHIHLVSVSRNEALSDLKAARCSQRSRVLIVDTSLSWGKCLEVLSQEQVEALATDIHLLMDVFWLNSASINKAGLTQPLYGELKSRLKTRLKWQ